VVSTEVIKLVSPMTRRDLMPKAEYDDYYVNVHTKKAAVLPGLRKYVAAICFRGVHGDEPPYDSIAELWWDNVESQQAIFQEPTWNEVRTDHTTFLSGRTMWLSEEHEFLNRVPPGAQPIRYVALLTRKDGMSAADFKRYWFERHVPLALETPGLLRYRACPSIMSVNAPSQAPFDGMVEMWFENPDAFDASFRDPFWNRLRTDYYSNFAMGRLQFLTREHLVFDSTK
jgi:uncharacterized protein (TIGR02118 family)